MTKAERAHCDRIVKRGCCACRKVLGLFSPAGVHHVRHQGKRDHMKIIPLCGPHHQTGGYGIAIHAGLEEWERQWGSELEYLQEES